LNRFFESQKLRRALEYENLKRPRGDVLLVVLPTAVVAAAAAAAAAVLIDVACCIACVRPDD